MAKALPRPPRSAEAVEGPASAVIRPPPPIPIKSDSAEAKLPTSSSATERLLFSPPGRPTVRKDVRLVMKLVMGPCAGCAAADDAPRQRRRSGPGLVGPFGSLVGVRRALQQVHELLLNGLGLGADRLVELPVGREHAALQGDTSSEAAGGWLWSRPRRPSSRRKTSCRSLRAGSRPRRWQRALWSRMPCISPGGKRPAPHGVGHGGHCRCVLVSGVGSTGLLSRNLSASAYRVNGFLTFGRNF